MSWFTEARDQLVSNLGVSSGSQAVNTAGQFFADALKSASPAPAPAPAPAVIAAPAASVNAPNVNDEKSGFFSRFPVKYLAIGAAVLVAALMIFKRRK